MHGWTIALAGIAGFAGWNDIGFCVLAPFGKWQDMIFGQWLNLTAIGTALVIALFNPFPFFFGQEWGDCIEDCETTDAC